jgi:transcriptional regulator with XRE-family HTH domain
MHPDAHPPRPNLAPPIEANALGLRIAGLRLELGLTQQELADRVAISRVALSNLESGRSVPGERTVTLLAGVFSMEPHELVANTSYPVAKSDRLPLVAARHTEVDLQLALLERDLGWLEGAPAAVAVSVVGRWRRELGALRDRSLDPRERQRIERALDQLTVAD